MKHTSSNNNLNNSPFTATNKRKYLLSFARKDAIIRSTEIIVAGIIVAIAVGGIYGLFS